MTLPSRIRQRGLAACPWPWPEHIGQRCRTRLAGPMAWRAWQDGFGTGPAAETPREVLMSVSDDFKVMIVGADGEAVVYLVGELDLAVRDLLVDALTQASDMRQRLVIDLSRTTFIDSTGLKALVDLWRRRRTAGLELVLREPSPVVMRTLQLAGLADVLPIDTTNRPTL